MDLFEKAEKGAISRQGPLAFRMRPRSLDEFVGQGHIVGEGKLLRRALRADRLGSLLFYGPPGSGKTSLAEVIARMTESHFERISAVGSNVAELRDMIKMAKFRLSSAGGKTILFIDEIHRFNKAQQDVLLPSVEEGSVILIGATTHNPFFSINAPLLSRSQVFHLRPLSSEETMVLLQRSLHDGERGLGGMHLRAEADALRHLAEVSDGDARRALNGLELAALTTPPDRNGLVHLTLGAIEESVQKKMVLYDRDEDGHYDTASAFIKSMRGSDPDAALYWLAKMLAAGEDPAFIVRRVIICAAEDVGNADPLALRVATTALQACEFVGMPEARIPLAQAVTYVATAPKSNAVCRAIEKAMRDVEEKRLREVPRSLKDASYAGAAKLGHGEGYRYPHSEAKGFADQEYGVGDRIYYEPTSRGYERTIGERLRKWRSLRKRKQSDGR